MLYPYFTPSGVKIKKALGRCNICIPFRRIGNIGSPAVPTNQSTPAGM